MAEIQQHPPKLPVERNLENTTELWYILKSFNTWIIFNMRLYNSSSKLLRLPQLKSNSLFVDPRVRTNGRTWLGGIIWPHENVIILRQNSMNKLFKFKTPSYNLRITTLLLFTYSFLVGPGSNKQRIFKLVMGLHRTARNDNRSTIKISNCFTFLNIIITH